MTDPIILAIAAAIAGKGAESVGAHAGPALARLARRIKERFAGHPEETAALTAAQAAPGAVPEAAAEAVPESATGSGSGSASGSASGSSRAEAGHPGEDQRTAALAAALTRAAAEDPAFAEELRALWQQVQAPTGDAVINNFNAPADKVVQLRDVHGGFHVS